MEDVAQVVREGKRLLEGLARPLGLAVLECGDGEVVRRVGNEEGVTERAADLERLLVQFQRSAMLCSSGEDVGEIVQR
jgi:hypothetical protein